MGYQAPCTCLVASLLSRLCQTRVKDVGASGTADKRYVEQNRRHAVDITAAKTPRAFIEEGVKITNGEIMDLSLFALIPECIQQ